MTDYAYMAFLDILGYRNLLGLDIAQGTQIFKSKMITAFRIFDGYNHAKFAYKAISDSIFISCQGRESAEDLLVMLRDVFVAFLGEGLLIRGGVSYGEHFQNHSITYSPVLTKAYQLESTIVHFPRIMIDPNIVDMFPELKEKLMVLRTGNNWYLNIATPENYDKLWHSAKETFENSKEDAHKDEIVRIKHRWLQDYLIEIASTCRCEHNPPYLPIFDDSGISGKA
jgi:hypothetical protein